MTFVVSGKLTIDASQGKSELSQLKASKDAVTTSAKTMTAEEAKAATGVRKLAAQAETAAAKNRLLSATETRVANEAVTMGRSHQLAAGQVGNLTAQFNDIGVMMAAGQNPFQLAIQQGTQITQVIGNMGAAGAAKALKAALVSMVSPLTLITIGSIAAGAALVNWLTGADEDIATVEDQLEALGDAIDTYADKAAKTRFSTAEMIEEFGKASPELRLVISDLAALAKMDAQKAIDATAKSVRALALEADSVNKYSNMADAQRFLGLGSVGRANREAGHQFAENLVLLDSTADAATRLAAALDIRDQLLDAAGGLKGLNTLQEEFYTGLLATIRDLEVFAGTLQAPWNELKATGADLWSSLTANVETYLGKRLQVETQARTQIELLRLEAETQQAITAFGEGSVEVAELRLQAERLAYEQQLESRDLSEQLKDELLEAWDAANGVASADMAGNISLAADEAHRLMVNMMKANGQEIMGRIRENPDFADPRGESRGAGSSDYVYQDHSLPDVDMPPNPKTRRSRKGGGAASYDKERKAIERLMERERQRIAVLRETDPVLKEMIRIRDQLKDATDAEREAVEALIRERVEEEQAIARTEAATD
ncbi:phage tail length tape measure family protein, partial [Pseudophaeobacter sp.]